MAEIVKPVARVLFHADCKGSELGSAIGLALALPYSMYKGEKVTLGGAACMAGAGLGIGSACGIIVAGVKLARMDKEAIKAKGAEMKVDKVDKAAGAAACVGLGMGLYRVSCAAKSTPDSSTTTTAALLLSKRGAWTLLAYTALGVGIVVGAHLAATGGKKAVENIKQRIEAAKNDSEASNTDIVTETADKAEEAVEAAANLLDEGAAAANGAVEDATEAVKTTVNDTVAAATTTKE